MQQLKKFLVGICLGIATCGSRPALPLCTQTFTAEGFLSSEALLQEKTPFLDFSFGLNFLQPFPWGPARALLQA